VRYLSIVAVLIAASAWSTNANAARQYSSNTVYFDASGNVTGQNAYFCNGVHLQGGDLTSPYYLHVDGSCGDLVVTCPSQGICDGGTFDSSVAAYLAGSPSFTLSEACVLTGDPNICYSQEPVIVPGLEVH
jgi:hypothetical protein